jgi:hypothetical protein
MPLNFPDTWGIKEGWSIPITERVPDVTAFIKYKNGRVNYVKREDVPDLSLGDYVVYKEKKEIKKAMLLDSIYDDLCEYWVLNDRRPISEGDRYHHETVMRWLERYKRGVS